MVFNPSRRLGGETTLDGGRPSDRAAIGDDLFGWLAAFNHEAGGEFGSSETKFALVRHAAILGIRLGQRLGLYRRKQAEFPLQRGV